MNTGVVIEGKHLTLDIDRVTRLSDISHGDHLLTLYPPTGKMVHVEVVQVFNTRAIVELVRHGHTGITWSIRQSDIKAGVFIINV